MEIWTVHNIILYSIVHHFIKLKKVNRASLNRLEYFNFINETYFLNFRQYKHLFN